LTCAIEDAGWQIRDCVMWIYGSGFPKSLDIGKNIDKGKGLEREFVGVRNVHRDNSIRTPLIYKGIGSEGKQGLAGMKSGGLTPITAPASPEAQQWNGFGSSLKPAYEPIVLAMKPLDGTFAENALKWGVGGLWIDGGRIDAPEGLTNGGKPTGSNSPFFKNVDSRLERTQQHPKGRWPSNIILDGSEEVLEGFPETSSGARNPTGKDNKFNGKTLNKSNTKDNTYSVASIGSAARFFYTAKASPSERSKDNSHPTIKPLALIHYLARLTKMPTDNSIILDPFMGSGTTLLAAQQEGRQAIGIELNEEYCKIAVERLRQPSLFSILDEEPKPEYKQEQF